MKAHAAALKSMSGALEEATVDGLQDEVDRTALLGEIRVQINRFVIEKPHQKNPQFWLDHVLEGLYLLLVRTDRSEKHLASAASDRLRDLPRVLSEAKETLEDCPQIVVDTAIKTAAGGEELVRLVSDRFSSSEDDELGAAAEEALSALGDLSSMLSEGVVTGNAEFAIGEEAFNFRLHYEHALNRTAPELWRYGLSLIDEVEGELEEIARATKFAGHWSDLVSELREEHPAAEELVDAYASEMRRAMEFVVANDIALIPDGRLDVVETPGFLRPLVPYAAYQPPGACSAERTGLFYVSMPDAAASDEDQDRMLRDHCYHELASTALHEGYPGHHLQILTAQQQSSDVRKFISSPITVEGWALYCEDMMGEQGFYSTIEQQLFQRVQLLWRAVRIVVDVGLHTRGMSVEEAEQMLVERAKLERSNAEAEVRRYCNAPAYQLCYAVGRRDFKLLREAYMQQQGSDYSLGAFHKAVLGYGGIPTSLIAWGLGLDLTYG